MKENTTNEEIIEQTSPVETPVETPAEVAEAPETEVPEPEPEVFDEPVQPYAKPKKCGHVPLIVILLILFLGAAGFGVFELLQNLDKDKKINSLKAELATATNYTIEYKKYESTNSTKNETKKPAETEKTEEKTEQKTEAPAETPVVSEDGYIYVGGGWRIKIKIPENLIISGYTYTNGILYVTGTTVGHQYVPDFSDILKNQYGLGAIAKYTSEEYNALSQKGTIVFRDGDDVYAYSSPQAVYSTTEDDKTWEQESAAAIKNMFSLNISKF